VRRRPTCNCSMRLVIGPRTLMEPSPARISAHHGRPAAGTRKFYCAGYGLFKNLEVGKRTRSAWPMASTRNFNNLTHQPAGQTESAWFT